MQSHRDDDSMKGPDFSKFFESLEETKLSDLEKEAKRLTALRQNTITAGDTGEKPIAEWRSKGVNISKMPDDPNGVLRISIGGGKVVVRGSAEFFGYCVLRGDRDKCIELLRRSLKALQSQKVPA